MARWAIAQFWYLIHTFFGIYSVKYVGFAGGAKGDGVANDTAAIQAALDAVANTGGAVFIPTGTYKITATLLISSNTMLFGSGPSSVIALAPAVNAIALQNKSHASTGDSYIHIEDIAMQGNRASGSPGGEQAHAIALSGVSNAIVNRCLMYDFQGDAVYISDSDNHTVNSRNVKVIANTFRNVFRNGVSVCGLDGGTISENVCEGAGLQGIDVEPWNATIQVCRSLDISGNVIRKGAGFAGTYSNYRGVTVSKSIAVEVSTITIRGNQYEGGDGGIWVVGAEEMTISGNTCRNYGSYGIQIQTVSGNTPRRITVSGNVCNSSLNTTSGIIVSTAQEVVLEGNRCNGNLQGISLADLTIGSIHANSVTGIGGTSRGITVSNSKQVNLSANIITGAYHGIDISRTTTCERVTLMANVLVNNIGYGVNLYPDINLVVIAGNVFQGNGGDMSVGTGTNVAQTNNLGNIAFLATATPKYNLGDDLQTTTAGKGAVVQTPDGTKKYRIRVDNAGTVVTDLVP